MASEPDAVECPDRHWIAQSVWHGDGVRLTTAALRHHFNDRDNLLAAMQSVVCYELGNLRARLRPDVQVAFDVKRAGNCTTFKLWAEGKGATGPLWQDSRRESGGEKGVTVHSHPE